MQDLGDDHCPYAPVGCVLHHYGAVDLHARSAVQSAFQEAVYVHPPACGRSVVKLTDAISSAQTFCSSRSP